jgi:predicted lipid-binding transport protein (Tim44 family)
MASRIALASFVAGVLIGSVLGCFGHGLVSIHLMVAAGIVFLMMLHRRRVATTGPVGAPADVSGDVKTLSGGVVDSSLDRGVRQIRQTDPGFDPSRFAGYAAMMFRDTESALVSRDLGPLRDRVTSEMYGRLQEQRDEIRSRGQTDRVEAIDIVAEITAAWQQSRRDYMTAYITGSRGHRPIEEFWTFTRPAGLNFWMLSAIQPLATTTGREPLP